MAENQSFEELDESEVVSAAQAGDALAFEELVRRHGDKIFRRALSMLRDEDTALDMAQMAWIKAWKRLKQFQGDSSFATWMTRNAYKAWGCRRTRLPSPRTGSTTPIRRAET